MATTNGYINALAKNTSNHVFAGGTFTLVNGVSANRIAKWNGSVWSALGSGRYVSRWDGSSWNALGSGVNGEVRAFAVDGTNLYVGGTFTTAGGTTVNGIALWNGSTWSALTGGGIGGTNIDGTLAVNALAIAVNPWTGNKSLFVGGDFTNAGGVTGANRIAKYGYLNSTPAFTLNWTAATDNVDAPSSLQYLVYYATNPNLSTVQEIKDNGTAFGEYA